MTVIITAGQAGQRVGDLLKREYGVSSSLLKAIKRREGALLRNGERVFTDARLAEGDVLFADLSDPAGGERVVPVPMALDIPYEDEELLIVNKSAPLAVHASSFAPDEPTLANALACRLGEEFILHPVNRLDRGTTGLMAVAKSRYVHNLLRRQLHSGTFYREYRAIAVGEMAEEGGHIRLPIGRETDSAIKRCISEEGQHAYSEYQVLARREGLTLLRLIPHTGRTHQLRVHMAAMGHPLLGDWLYGTEERERIARPALHAAVLHLRHPISGEQLSLEAVLPPDMARFFPEGQPG